LLILGIPAAFINVLAICNMIDTLKTKFNVDEHSAHDMSSALFNLSLMFGECIGPAFGGYITEYSSFSASCVGAGFINLIYVFIFVYINYVAFMKEINEKIMNKTKTNVLLDLKNMDDDFSYNKSNNKSNNKNNKELDIIFNDSVNNKIKK
jgi:hypothetical protein